MPVRIGEEVQEVLRRGDGELISPIRNYGRHDIMKVLHIAVQRDTRTPA